MRGAKELWRRAATEAKERWTHRALRRGGAPGGITDIEPIRHCALGIIGHVSVDGFDTELTSWSNGNSETAYKRLQSSGSRSRQMVAELAAELRTMLRSPAYLAQLSHMENMSAQTITNADYYLSPTGKGGGDDQSLIMAVNDRVGQVMIADAFERIAARHEAEETEAAAQDIAKSKITKKDLKVEYQPNTIKIETEEVAVHGG